MPRLSSTPAVPVEYKSTVADVNQARENGTDVKDEILKRVLLKNLSQLFKPEVLAGPVYTLEVLKQLHLMHLGIVPEIK